LPKLSSEPSNSFTAFLPLSECGRLNADALDQAVKRWSPGAAATAVGSDQSVSFIVNIGPSMLMVMIIDAPLPLDMMTTAKSNKQLMASLRQHQGHILVRGPSMPADVQSRVFIANQMTVVCAALLETTPSIAVYWEASSSVTAKAEFMAAAARKISPETTVWFSRFFFNGTASVGKETIGCVTHGLHALIGREIEFEPAPRNADAIEATVNMLAAHLLGGGKTIKHGDSIGRTATDKTYVAILDSGKQTDVPVYMLVVPD
jgi:hypothetical protein